MSLMKYKQLTSGIVAAFRVCFCARGQSFDTWVSYRSLCGPKTDKPHGLFRLVVQIHVNKE